MAYGINKRLGGMDELGEIEDRIEVLIRIRTAGWSESVVWRSDFSRNSTQDGRAMWECLGH